MKHSISYFLMVFGIMTLLAGCSRSVPAPSTEPSQNPPKQTATPGIQPGNLVYLRKRHGRVLFL